MRKDTVSTLKTCNSTSQRTLLLFIASSFRATLCTLPKPSIKFSWVQLKFSDHRAFFNNFYILKGATTKNQYIVTHTHANRFNPSDKKHANLKYGWKENKRLKNKKILLLLPLWTDCRFFHKWETFFKSSNLQK